VKKIKVIIVIIVVCIIAFIVFNFNAIKATVVYGFGKCSGECRNELKFINSFVAPAVQYPCTICNKPFSNVPFIKLCSDCSKSLDRCDTCGKFNTYKEEIILDSNLKFKVETPSHYMTMQNDGGSHTNIYYEIDLENGTVKQLQDQYKGFEGYVYKGKINYSKNLTADEIKGLHTLFDEVIANKDEINEENDLDYNYYIFVTEEHGEVKVYDKELIQNFLNLVK